MNFGNQPQNLQPPQNISHHQPPGPYYSNNPPNTGPVNFPQKIPQQIIQNVGIQPNFPQPQFPQNQPYGMQPQPLNPINQQIQQPLIPQFQQQGPPQYQVNRNPNAPYQSFNNPQPQFVNQGPQPNFPGPIPQGQIPLNQGNIGPIGQPNGPLHLNPNQNQRQIGPYYNNPGNQNLPPQNFQQGPPQNFPPYNNPQMNPPPIFQGQPIQGQLINQGPVNQFLPQNQAFRYEFGSPSPGNNPSLSNPISATPQQFQPINSPSPYYQNKTANVLKSQPINEPTKTPELTEEKKDMSNESQLNKEASTEPSSINESHDFSKRPIGLPEPPKEPYNPIPKKLLAFSIDAVPIAEVTTTENDPTGEKKLESSRGIEEGERQYKILGYDRSFRTKETNLFDKLKKFLIEDETEKEKEKPEAEKENEKEVEGEEKDLEGEEKEEFNYESRYFLYNPTQVCFRCKKPGHLEKWCTDDVVLKCHFCLGNHEMRDCTQIICFNCNGTGHRSKDCTYQERLTCYRCGKRGHKNTRCGVLFPRDRDALRKEKKDYNISTKCLVCGRYGHPICDTSKKKKKFRGSRFDDMYDDGTEDVQESDSKGTESEESEESDDEVEEVIQKKRKIDEFSLRGQE